MNVPHSRPKQWVAPIDPVCGRPIEPIPIAYSACHADHDYYFCSVQCLEAFKSYPSKFVRQHALPSRITQPTAYPTSS
ncbi:hypothetical protein GCM10027430_31500 [Lysobacter tyrosinilyticus]